MSKIEAWGVGFDSPSGTEAAIFRGFARDQPDVFACLHVASFGIPSEHRSAGYGQILMEMMGNDDIVVALLEMGADSYVDYDAVQAAKGGFSESEPVDFAFSLRTGSFADQGFPARMTAGSFRDVAIPQTGSIRADNPGGVQVAFSMGGRPFVLVAVIGSLDRADQQVARVNEVLQAIEIQSAVAIFADLTLGVSTGESSELGGGSGEASYTSSSRSNAPEGVTVTAQGSFSRDSCEEPLEASMSIDATLSDGRRAEIPVEVSLPPGLASGIAETTYDGVYGMPLPTPFRIEGDICQPDQVRLSMPMFPLESRFS